MAERIPVKKTYKNFVGGKFSRSESGQTLMLEDRKGNPVAACCKSSRKDFRDAVLAARSGLGKWRPASAYLKGQILYRAAEMLEGRSGQFVEELQLQGLTRKQAGNEVQKAVDCLVHYAGWCDKVSQFHSSVNPVASPHFCFTVPEPTGVIAVLAGGGAGFSGIINGCARILAGGNALILVTGNRLPVSCSTLGEVWHTSDIPGGTVNILTGSSTDLAETVSTHRDVDGILGLCLEPALEKSIQEGASDSLKRLRFAGKEDLDEDSPYAIAEFLEMKTTWHPVGF